jgi:hypothetical protein
MGIYKQAYYKVAKIAQEDTIGTILSDDNLQGRRGTFNYVPAKLKELATPEELALLNESYNRMNTTATEPILGGIFGGLPATIASLGSIGAIPTGAALLAAATPSWTKADVREYIADEDLKTKLTWIPGYSTYTRMKLLGAHNRIKADIERRYK